ncbi:PREDICTED: microtubule-associated protein TORTIFOLIA1 [Tarenaya hassleriana]|uniref:microtubule-associated protein TORTIFOLIA1 n=1 Tax=Tarenaya hassleriana TaxID=28532 RepID=UPI00053C206F|nr:PREDICTED: microtubule-associated protein TORTIFOLIA1 [Tarenaya hassleriana]XP_019058285.1 PREDICTED: microtubule-associated protein TORTIFOLIA1 [Tarenaya hassleriana]
MTMKANMQTRVRGGNTRLNTQQMIFELKNKVVLALNKLADRDTYQIGVEELEKTVEHLAPDKVSSFLSCILDIDPEQKSAVRKECIRLMGTLARFHEGLVGPYLGKMVSSIVKRLKDPDSIVRDACVETMGVLASKMSCYEDQNYGVFISLVKPLFEAIGEQNKYIQSGSALCLARVMDNTPDPPVPLLQRMLTRTVKLLNNPHFMAKPAVIELNRSIIQAGGATTKSVLFSAMTSLQDSLKNSDWTTRKAAAVALTAIASTGGSFLGPLKASCIRSLESCRFDKVKPVRDSVVLALQYWKGVHGSGSPEPSETGSSVKESFGGARESNESVSTSESKFRDATSKKYVTDLARNRIPFSARKAPASYCEDTPKSKHDNWQIEIAVPKSPLVSRVDIHNEESEGSCTTKMFVRKTADVASTTEMTYEYIPMDDKPESCVTNNVNEDEDIKSMTVSSSSFPPGVTMKPAVRNKQFVAEEIDTEEQPFSTKLRDRISLDSTVTVSSTQINHDCCAQIADEMASIRKQLSDIENKQASLIDHLQVFSTGVMNSLSVLQSKVLSLEYAVEGIAQNFVSNRSFSDLSNSNFVKHNQGILSPRLSSCTPRPSTDSRNWQSTLSSTKYSATRENKGQGRSVRLQEPTNTKQGVINTRSNPVGKVSHRAREDIWSSIRQGTETIVQTRKIHASSDSSQSTSRQHHAESRKLVKGVSCEDELESEYMEMLSSDDELALFELLDRTGPVLDSLSSRTVNDLLGILVSYLLERRFMNSILPWLYQVVDLSVARGPNYLVPSAKTRAELLAAVQEAAGTDFSNLSEKRLVTQLAAKLHKLWGK